MVGGAVPALKGDDFLALLPRDEVELVFEEFANVPSSHFTPARALELAQRIELLLMAPDVDGVVVSHGTDTLEETAYLLDLTLNSTKPVVVTSSLRPVTSAGYDGIANLSNAIRVAAAPQARELGVLVLVDEQIFAASEVQQLDSQTVQAFQAPETGPLGRILGKTLRFAHHPHAASISLPRASKQGWCCCGWCRAWMTSCCATASPIRCPASYLRPSGAGACRHGLCPPCTKLLSSASCLRLHRVVWRAVSVMIMAMLVHTTICAAWGVLFCTPLERDQNAHQAHGSDGCRTQPR